MQIQRGEVREGMERGRDKKKEWMLYCVGSIIYIYQCSAKVIRRGVIYETPPPVEWSSIPTTNQILYSYCCYLLCFGNINRRKLNMDWIKESFQGEILKTFIYTQIMKTEYFNKKLIHTPHTHIKIIKRNLED